MGSYRRFSVPSGRSRRTAPVRVSIQNQVSAPCHENISLTKAFLRGTPETERHREALMAATAVDRENASSTPARVPPAKALRLRMPHPAYNLPCNNVTRLVLPDLLPEQRQDHTVKKVLCAGR